jgi:hypothetical protein
MGRDRRNGDRRQRDEPIAVDRRRTTRRVADRRMDERVTVQVWLAEEDDRPGTFCRAADLSAGGMYVDLGLPQPAGTITRLVFTLPGDRQEVHVTAEVVPCDDRDLYGTHLKFKDLSGEDHIRISRFLEDQLR